MTERLIERQSRLTSAQRTLLEERIRHAARATPSPGRISRRPDPAAPVPLSSAQQRLWVLDQLVPGNSWYNMTRTVRIEGALAPDALALSLEGVVARHESLRTTIASRDGQPVQIVAPHSRLPLPIIRLDHVPERNREETALALALEDAERPFDLSHGPLLRAMLLRLSPQHHILHVTSHHIVTDGWSMELFFGEISSFYQAFSTGAAPSLPPLEIQYADFCLWQRNWLDTEPVRTQITHWTERLRGAASLELPTDHPRPATPTFRGAHLTRVLPPRILEGLHALARREGATLFMVLLAAFEVFLQRHASQDDVSVATPIAGRSLPELENLIGFFANTIVLRGDLSGRPTFREVIRRVRETTLDAYAHPDAPLEKIVEVLRPERSLSGNPLAQVLCVLQNTPPAELRLSGARTTPLELLTRTSRFDLELHARETAGGLSCTLISATDLFEEQTLERLLDRFETLLGAIVEDPDRCIGKLELLPDAERRRILCEWNQPEQDFSTERLIHELFELRAERAPASVAVEFEDKRVTYEELNRRANQLAWHLRGLGVGPEVLVGVCLERSLEMVVALIAVLKAGGAYVPLDPAYPAERLAFMLEDAHAPVLVTEERLGKSLRAGAEVRVCLLDRDVEAIGGEERRNPERLGTPENLAYVIYTSGSTGKPKGVMVTHGNVDRLFTATEPWFQFDERDVWTLFHSYAFDFSVWELWGALRYGGRLVIIPQWVARSPEAFHELLGRSGVTVLNQTPSAFRALIACDASSSAQLFLRLVIFGGEALEPAMLEPWFDRHGEESPRLVNMYGITETTVHVTYHPVTKEDLRRPSASVIGRPIPDLQIYLLDRDLEVCPIGVAGEMHIAGAGLARGYLRRPELTDERFIPNPFAARKGERLYKSGDLARYRADGELEYLGRMDQQVKIRGHRIELGEIETVLGQHPDVREVAVIAREETPGDRRLVAYVVGNGSSPPSGLELRVFLKRSLPDYMVPAVFVPLDRMPSTPSGKVDRRALPVPDPTRPELEDAFVAPHTPVEEVLARIWAQVLRVERIGTGDNFFDLGGDSILAIQIIARANQAGLGLTPKQLFQHQTISELAAVAETAPVIYADQGLVTGSVPLTPIQLWFFEGDSPDPHHFNQAFLLELPQRLEPAMLKQAVGHLLVHHDALRLRFFQVDKSWEQSNAAAEDNPVFTRFDLSSLPPAEQDTAIEAEAARLQAGLKLSQGPLIQTALFDLGTKRPSRLLVVVHHLAVDGVSWWILLEDLQTAYLQLARGEPLALPPKTTSFKEWAERLAAHVRSEPLKRELDYWLAEPGDRIRRLPVDSAAGRNTEASARRVSVSLDAAETQALLQEVPSAYRTQINDVLLTALAKAFLPWTGPGALPVNLEGHGREEVFPDVDLSRTVGWFTAIFPLLLNLKESADSSDALRGVKEQLRAIPNRGIGYGLLRYLSDDPQVVARLKALPQPEVSFNYLGQFDQALSDSSLFVITRESSGPAHSLRALRRHLIDVECVISEGQLRIDWVYSASLHRRAAIERLAADFVEALRCVIASCQSAEGGYTPSDFPLAGLGQKSLDRVLRRFGKT